MRGRLEEEVPYYIAKGRRLIRIMVSVRVRLHHHAPSEREICMRFPSCLRASQKRS